MYTYCIIRGVLGIALIFAALLFRRKEPRRIIYGLIMLVGLWYTISSVFDILVLLLNDISSVYQVFGVVVPGVVVLASVVLGAALFINGIVVVRKEGRSITNLLPIGFSLLEIGASIVFIGYNFLNWSMSAFQYFLLDAVYRISLYVPIAFGTFLVFCIMYDHVKKSYNVDFIVVLGCGVRSEEVTPLLRGRLDKAIEVYEKGTKKSTFVVSGGQGSDEPVSEAFAMKKYLVSQGISEDRIIMEDKSTSTQENLLFSDKKMKAVKENYSCIISTSNYHVYRTVMIARALGLDAQGVGGKTAKFYSPAAWLREAFALIFNYRKAMLVYFVLAFVYSYVHVYYGFI